MITVHTDCGIVQVDQSGVARIGTMEIGTVEYSHGRYVARGANGKIRQFTQGDRDTGETIQRHAARWLARHGW
jgi:hypothetical protein